MYTLAALAILPLVTLTPGTNITSLPPFLPFILKISATKPLPFYTPFITAPFFLFIADYSKSFKKLWIRRWTFGTIFNSFWSEVVSEWASVPKVKISAEQVAASSISFAVTSPTSDFRILTSISFCFLSF